MKTTSILKKGLAIITLAFSSPYVSAQTDQADPASVLTSILGEAATKYEWKFNISQPSGASELKFSDNTLNLEFVPMDEKQWNGPYTWSFWLENKTNANIQVDWDKSYVTSFSGEVRPVYHGEVKSINKTAKQKPTVVAAKSKIGEAVTPKDGVITTKHDGYWDDNGKWIEPWNEITGYQLFYGKDLPSESAKVNETCIGKSFKLRLAMIIGGAVKNYDFTFNVSDIVITKSEGSFLPGY